MPAPERPRGVTRRSSSSTITQVAERAGVSTATVSRVFANPDRVSEDLRARVDRAARALDYRPSRVARHLRVGTSMTIGVVIPDIQNPFFTSVVRGIEQVLQAAGNSLLLANSDERPEREERALDTLQADGVAGIVFVPIGARRSSYKFLASRPLPLVAVDRLPAGLHVDLVTVDNAGGSRRAVEHLIAMGHRAIALLGGPPQHSTASEREAGYDDALREAGLPRRPELTGHGNFRQEGGYDAMRALLQVPNPPTAVFVANNLMALGALRAIHESGRRIPLDIAVVSFDDMPWATSLNPPLSAVAQPAWEIGEAAGELLLSRIAQPDRPVRQVVLDTQLMVRASSSQRVDIVPANAPPHAPADLATTRHDSRRR